MGGIYKSDGTKSGPLGYFHPETGKIEMPILDKVVERWMNDGTLTKAHMDFIQEGMWNRFNRHYDDAAEGIRRVDGTNIGFIEPRKMSTPWGDYDGGYVPTGKDKVFGQDRKIISDFATEDPRNFYKDLFPHANTSFAKERTTAYYPLSLDLGSLRYELNTVYKAAYLRPTMFEAGKIFDNDSFRQSLDQRRPGALDSLVIPWYKRVMAQQYSTPWDVPGGHAIDNVVHMARNNARLATFILNYGTMLKHTLGVFPASQLIDSSYLWRAAADVGLQHSKAINDISEVSPRMAVRFKNNAIEATRSFEDFHMNHDALSKMDEYTNKLAFAPLQYMQSHTDSIVFKAAVDQATSSFKMSNEEAYKYAADVVERTQLTTNISSRPGIMHGNEIKRALTDYAPIALNMHNLIHESRMRNADAPTVEKVQNQLGLLVRLALLPTILGTVMSHPGKAVRAVNGEGDDEGKYYKDMAASVAADSLEVHAPLVGRNLLALTKGELGTPAINTVLNAGKNTYRTGQKIFNPDKELSAKDIGNMLDAVTMTTRVPLSTINKAFKNLLEFYPEIDQNR
jgi:hypothetical protein